MMIYVAGSGRLADELLNSMVAPAHMSLVRWDSQACVERPAIVIHAGSGREIEDIVRFCSYTGSTLIDAATTTCTLPEPCPFPYIECPNANLLMLRFIAMLKDWGHVFQNYAVSLLESHQQTKTSPPGTAFELARVLGVPCESVISIREPTQQALLGLAQEHLNRHAFHRIMISDPTGHIKIETSITGDAPYAAGLSTIVAAISSRPPSYGRHRVIDMVRDGLI